MKRSGVEDREERWVRRSWKGREDLLVEASEEGDRLRLRHPERPRVIRLEALETRRSEKRLEEEAGERQPRRRDE